MNIEIQQLEFGSSPVQILESLTEEGRTIPRSPTEEVIKWAFGDRHQVYFFTTEQLEYMLFHMASATKPGTTYGVQLNEEMYEFYFWRHDDQTLVAGRSARLSDGVILVWLMDFRLGHDGIVAFAHGPEATQDHLVDFMVAFNFLMAGEVDP